MFTFVQKQLFIDVSLNGFSEKIRKIDRKTAAMDSFFNKFAECKHRTLSKKDAIANFFCEFLQKLSENQN